MGGRSDLLARVKPKLANLEQKDGRTALLDELQRLAALGETFSEQRTRSKMGADMADVLDREGAFGLSRHGCSSR